MTHEGERTHVALGKLDKWGKWQNFTLTQANKHQKVCFCLNRCVKCVFWEVAKNRRSLTSSSGLYSTNYSTFQFFYIKLSCQLSLFGPKLHICDNLWLFCRICEHVWTQRNIMSSLDKDQTLKIKTRDNAFARRRPRSDSACSRHCESSSSTLTRGTMRVEDGGFLYIHYLPSHSRMIGL